MSLGFIEENLKKIKQQIDDCCLKHGRDPGSVRLLPVTKRQPLEKLQELYRLGERAFGENQVLEMQTKAEQLPNDIEWHLIGSLQSNKAKKAVSCADVIHSVDSEKLIERLNRLAGEAGRCPKIYLQVNISGEASKRECKFLRCKCMFSKGFGLVFYCG